jgi:hypothetical protein
VREVLTGPLLTRAFGLPLEVEERGGRFARPRRRLLGQHGQVGDDGQVVAAGQAHLAHVRDHQPRALAVADEDVVEVQHRQPAREVRASPRPRSSWASRSPVSSSRRNGAWSRSALKSPSTTAGSSAAATSCARSSSACATALEDRQRRQGVLGEQRTGVPSTSTVARGSSRRRPRGSSRP